jgi:hypothetical protein
MVGIHNSRKNFRASLVTLTTQCVARMGLRLRVFSERSPLARTKMLPSGMHTPWAGSNRKPQFRSSIPFRAGRYSLTFHPHYLSVYASTNDFGDSPYTLAATLDTGPGASGYPDGIPARSSSNYFQSARASDGSPVLNGSGTGTSWKATASVDARRKPFDRPKSIVQSSVVPIIVEM